MTAPYDLVHVLAEPAAGVAGVGAVLGWLVDTACALVFGLAVGAVIVAVMHLIPRRGSGDGHRDAARGGDPRATEGTGRETDR